MKVPKFKSRKLPEWELRTPQWRKNHYKNYSSRKKDVDLSRVISQCAPGDSFLCLKWTSPTTLQRNAILCGTWVLTRQTTYNDKKVQRIWVIYPPLTETQLEGKSRLPADIEGPCVPNWKFPAGVVNYKADLLYDDATKTL